MLRTHFRRAPLLVAGLLIAIGLRGATSARAAASLDKGFIAAASTDVATAQLTQFPDLFGNVVPSLTVYYFDAIAGRFYYGSRALVEGEFMQDASSAWVAPGIELEISSFDFCTGEAFTLNTVVGPEGLTWDGAGPMMHSMLTIFGPGQQIFSKSLAREAVVVGSLGGDLDVDLGSSVYTQVGRILQRVNF